MKYFFLLFLSLVGVGSFAVNFEQYFEEKTLRIDYIHSGNFENETFQKLRFIEKNGWAGSTVNLVDTFDYGKHKIVVRDSVSNYIIFSRGFSTLFDEWRTTPEGKNVGNNKSFEETFCMPFPRNTVVVDFFSRDKQNNWKLIFSTFLNSRIEKIEQRTSSLAAIPLHYSGKPTQCLDLIIFPDGYGFHDTLAMKRDFDRIKSAILNCEPYKSYAGKINIWAVEMFTVNTTKPVKKSVANTQFGILSFNALGLDRYLMTEKVHELGHSFAGLADEYYDSEVTVQNFYPLDVEPWEPNITSLINFDKKWKYMLPKQTKIPTPVKENLPIGVYEGAGYMSTGLYRPRKTCSMKDAMYDHFCPVCNKAILDMLQFCIN